MTYSKEELKGLQDKSLEMAQYFVEFCNENQLLCYLCGGGCIGTLRHEGFIPWDDDLDFFMPRRDYEKLIAIWKNANQRPEYEFSKSNQNKIDRNLFVTIRDANTTQIKPYQCDLDIPQGVALDILPLDGYPDSKMKRRIQCLWALIYSLFCAQTIPINHGKAKRILAKIALGIVRNERKRFNIWRFAEKQMTKYRISECSYITELCSGPYYMKKKYNKSAFEAAEWKRFENTWMPIPKGYDHYLKTAFGNYMELPPKEKRIAHHETEFLDLRAGYKGYKGIKYCKEVTR